MGDFTNNAITQILNTLTSDQNNVAPNGKALATIPTGDASGNSGDHYFDAGPQDFYFKSGLKWVVIDSSVAFAF